VAHRSLSEEEVEQAIRKIRQMYDDYIVTYLKPFTLKQAFEDRYFDARKKRIGLDRFILDEMEVVRHLRRQEEEKIAEKEARRDERLEKRTRSVTEYAEQLFEQFREQIAKYPELPFHERASNELRRLFGALDLFEKEYWPPLDRVLRKLYPSFYNNPAAGLEPRIHALTSGAGHSPPRLSRYQSLLDRFPKRQKDAEWEEKQLLLECAHLLHSVSDVIASIDKELPAEARKEVEKTADFVHTLIADFRMKDLKPSGQGVP